MRVALLLLTAAAMMISMPALAGNKGKKAQNDNAAQHDASQAIVTLITATEQTIIFNYVNQHREVLVTAPGSGKPLPPGIAKKVARGDTLPPGIAKRYLPRDLLVQLPPRQGYQWVVVDNDVLLIAAATGLIVDVLADLL